MDEGGEIEGRIYYDWMAWYWKMNSNDISNLSYKELQALALRYRVPGNIKVTDLLLEI